MSLEGDTSKAAFLLDTPTDAGVASPDGEPRRSAEVDAEFRKVALSSPWTDQAANFVELRRRCG